MRYIPNVITFLRIALAAALLFAPPLSVCFFVLYILGGVSDMADGALARRLGVQSVFGSRLDSAADAAFLAAVFFSLRHSLALNALSVTWIAVIALIKLKNFHKIGAKHTIADKCVGALLFVYPFTLLFTKNIWLVYILCAAATYAAFDERR